MSDSVLPELFGFLLLGCRNQPSHQPFSEGSVERCPFLDGLLVPSPQLRHSFRRTNRRIGVNSRVPCCFHGRAADRFPHASGFDGCMDAWISEPRKNSSNIPQLSKARQFYSKQKRTCCKWRYFSATFCESTSREVPKLALWASFEIRPT